MIQWLEAKTQRLQPRNKGNVSPSSTSALEEHIAAKASVLRQRCACAESSGAGIPGYKAVACYSQGQGLAATMTIRHQKKWDFTNECLIELIFV